jgi:hypothetical protein
VAVLSSVFVVAGCVTGVIGIWLAIRHHEGVEVSKWIAGGLGLLAIGAVLSAFA